MRMIGNRDPFKRRREAASLVFTAALVLGGVACSNSSTTTVEGTPPATSAPATATPTGEANTGSTTPTSAAKSVGETPYESAQHDLRSIAAACRALLHKKPGTDYTQGKEVQPSGTKGDGFEYVGGYYNNQGEDKCAIGPGETVVYANTETNVSGALSEGAGDSIVATTQTASTGVRSETVYPYTKAGSKPAVVAASAEQIAFSDIYGMQQTPQPIGPAAAYVLTTALTS
jgi:hypothetical protein